MIDYHKEIVEVLSKILPTHYELFIDRATATPCITYIEANNSDNVVGDTINYSTVAFLVKVWSNKVQDLQTYAGRIDEELKPLGFKRTSSNELFDPNSTMGQKIMRYEAFCVEIK